jgi:apolipoprotein D and lipocalin family protein
MDDAEYRALLSRFQNDGYDIAQFRRVPQSPDEIGKQGYQ